MERGEPEEAPTPAGTATGAGAEDGTAGRAPRTVVDVLAGTAVTLTVALVIATEQSSAPRPDTVAYLFAIGFGALILARRRAPRTVIVVTVLGLFAYYTMDYPTIGIAVPVVAALFSAADAGLMAWAVGAGAVVFVTSTSFRLREGESLDYVFGYSVVTEVMLIATAIALGSTLRAHRIREAQRAEIARLTELQFARDADMRMQRERESLSRDLHDVLGHRMSVISLHTNVAREAVGHDDAAASDALDHIHTASAQALGDLRSMVRILRSASGNGDAPRTMLSLAGLPDLVRTARTAGVEVTTEIAVDPAELSPPVDAAAYRIVQESITNVIRHADATRAHVAVDLQAGTVTMSITDNGRGSTADGTPTGHGLAGMAERARLLGGSLTTSSADGSGFTVRARLPARLES